MLRTNSNDNVPKSCLQPKALFWKKICQNTSSYRFLPKQNMCRAGGRLKRHIVEKINTCKMVCSPALEARDLSSLHLWKRVKGAAAPQLQANVCHVICPPVSAFVCTCCCTNRLFMMCIFGVVTVGRVGLKPVKPDKAAFDRATHLSRPFQTYSCVWGDF